MLSVGTLQRINAFVPFNGGKSPVSLQNIPIGRSLWEGVFADDISSRHEKAKNMLSDFWSRSTGVLEI